MDRTLTAPGKLFLAGEYSVLWGGVARVLAAGPRTSAVVRRNSNRQVHVCLEDGRLSGLSTPAGVKWAGAVDARFHFVACTLNLAFRAIALEGPGLSVAFEPSPTSGGHKLGMGSSARAAVLAAEAARSALSGSFDALKLALVAHADAQRGKGSGGDVAACFAGGLVRYRRYDTARLLEAAATGALAGLLGDAPPVDLVRAPPPALPLVYAFSGTSASTGSLITAVERQWSPDQRLRFVERSDALGQTLEEALAKGQLPAAGEAMEALQALLWSLGPTRSEALERVLAIGRLFGCPGKQSGAGGGDGAILAAPDLATRDRLLTALAERHFFAMPVAVEPGLQGAALAPPELTGWLDAV